MLSGELGVRPSISLLCGAAPRLAAGKVKRQQIADIGVGLALR